MRNSNPHSASTKSNTNQSPTLSQGSPPPHTSTSPNQASPRTSAAVCAQGPPNEGAFSPSSTTLRSAWSRAIRQSSSPVVERHTGKGSCPVSSSSSARNTQTPKLADSPSMSHLPNRKANAIL